MSRLDFTAEINCGGFVVENNEVTPLTVLDKLVNLLDYTFGEYGDKNKLVTYRFIVEQIGERPDNLGDN